MSSAQTITTSAKQTNAQTQARQQTNRWSKIEADVRFPIASSKKQFKQQRQQRERQRRLKNDLIFNLRISQEFRFIQFVYTFRNIPNRICKTKFEKEILKLGRRTVHALSNMQNEAISRCCFVTFCKQRQRNK